MMLKCSEVELLLYLIPSLSALYGTWKLNVSPQAGFSVLLMVFVLWVTLFKWTLTNGSDLPGVICFFFFVG